MVIVRLSFVPNGLTEEGVPGAQQQGVGGFVAGELARKATSKSYWCMLCDAGVDSPVL